MQVDYTKEVWKDIVGYEGFYQVSDLGRVQSLDRTIKPSGKLTVLVKGVVLKPILRPNGPCYIFLSKENKQHCCNIAHLVLNTFVGPPKGSGKWNGWIDENKTNNALSNVFWVIPGIHYKENQKAYVKKNRKRISKYYKQYKIENRKQLNYKSAAAQRIRTRSKRRELALLLGNKCCKCGFGDERVFEFHHSNNDGRYHRKKLGSNSGACAYYYRLINEVKQGNPNNIELTCANCHLISHWVSDEELSQPGYRGDKRFAVKQS